MRHALFPTQAKQESFKPQAKEKGDKHDDTQKAHEGPEAELIH
jgi:hypothetical protein